MNQIRAKWNIILNRINVLLVWYVYFIITMHGTIIMSFSISASMDYKWNRYRRILAAKQFIVVCAHFGIC